jgi:MFS family permease
VSTTQLAARVAASPGQGAVRLSIVAMGLGYAITGADPTILSTNLVKVEHGLQLSSNTGSFMASLATLSLAATILGAGTLGDLYGKKRLFVYGLVGTIVFDLLAAAAPNAAVLLIARALVGVSFALLLGLSLAIVSASVPTEKRAGAIGTYLASAFIVSAPMPLIGAALADAFGWRTLFLVAPAFALVTLPLVLRYTPEIPATPGRPLDVIGIVAAAVMLVSLVFGISQLQGGLTSTSVVPIVVAVVAGAFFVWWEFRTAHPALDIGLFRQRNFSVAVAAGIAFNFLTGGLTVVIGYYVVAVKGDSTFTTALFFLPAAAAQAVSAVLAGRLVQRRSARLTMALGLAFLIAACLVYAVLRQSTPLIVLGVAMVLMSVGNAFTQTPESDLMMSSAPPEQGGSVAAVKSGIGQAFYSLGPSVMTLLVGGFFLARWHGELAKRGYSTEQADQALQTAQSSIEGHLGASSSLNPDLLNQIVLGAQNVLAGAISTTCLIIAVIPVVALLVTWLGLREAKQPRPRRA